PAAGRIYLPTASYIEMTEWALPPETAKRIEELRHRLWEGGQEGILSFLRGGHWRNFLAKYPEINDMHKKMLLVHDKVYSLPPSPARDKAQDELWKAQGNDPYWHGSFGGVYLPHLRTVPYQHLLAAEDIADGVLHPENDWLEYIETDFRRDGEKQLLVNGNKMNLYFAPAERGSLFEWDWREKKLNLLDTLTRRPEAYHHKVREVLTSTPQPEQGAEKVKTIHELARVKEPGLETLLHYDPYRRVAFLDHFLDENTTLDQFQSGDYQELADFAAQKYDYSFQETEEGLIVILSRQGIVQAENMVQPVYLEKRFHIAKSKAALPVTYSLTNKGDKPIEVRFGVEVNLGLLSGHSPAAFYQIPGINLDDPHLDSRGEAEAIKQLLLVNHHLGVRLQCELERLARLWRFPIQTVSSSEAGWEKVYQASSLLFIWDAMLQPNQAWETSQTWTLQSE
ncbi:MAG: DUF1926 domain-containing protein, partial [Chloroflexi bacterium]|nr:DUF1926 domain-containing protein [Chloroflexota bacterium]